MQIIIDASRRRDGVGIRSFEHLSIVSQEINRLLSPAREFVASVELGHGSTNKLGPNEWPTAYYEVTMALAGPNNDSPVVLTSPTGGFIFPDGDADIWPGRNFLQELFKDTMNEIRRLQAAYHLLDADLGLVLNNMRQLLKPAVTV